MARLFSLLAAMALGWVGNAAQAVPLPLTLYFADATARYQDAVALSDPITDDPRANRTVVVPGPAGLDQAHGSGSLSATNDPLSGNTVGGSATVLGANSFPGATTNALEATGLAHLVSQWKITGQPVGSPADVDLALVLDGTMEGGTSFVDPVTATISFRLTVHDSDGVSLLFDGSASLAVAGGAHTLSTAGSLGPEAFIEVNPTPNLGSQIAYRFHAEPSFENAMELVSGDVFAVELEVLVRSAAPGPFEAFAFIGNVENLAISSDSPGIRVEAVPEPGSLSLGALGFLGLAAAGRRRRNGRRA